MAQHRKILLIGIALAGIYSAMYITRFAYQEWQNEAGNRVHEARYRELRQKWSRIRRAARQLSLQGALFEVGKGNIDYTHLDLSQWRGTHKQLTDLKEFNLLKEVPHYPTCDLSIVLGPGVTDSDVTILAELHVLSKIDVTDSGLSRSGIQKLCIALPHLTVGEIDKSYFTSVEEYHFQ